MPPGMGPYLGHGAGLSLPPQWYAMADRGLAPGPMEAAYASGMYPGAGHGNPYQGMGLPGTMALPSGYPMPMDPAGRAASSLGMPVDAGSWGPTLYRTVAAGGGADTGMGMPGAGWSGMGSGWAGAAGDASLDLQAMRHHMMQHMQQAAHTQHQLQLWQAGLSAPPATDGGAGGQWQHQHQHQQATQRSAAAVHGGGTPMTSWAHAPSGFPGTTPAGSAMLALAAWDCSGIDGAPPGAGLGRLNKREGDGASGGGSPSGSGRGSMDSEEDSGGRGGVARGGSAHDSDPGLGPTGPGAGLPDGLVVTTTSAGGAHGGASAGPEGRPGTHGGGPVTATHAQYVHALHAQGRQGPGPGYLAVPPARVTPASSPGGARHAAV
jgi:hypothetical protein